MGGLERAVVEFRRFELHRDVDVSGVSGTGVVADGVQFSRRHLIVFPDGRVCEFPAGWVRLCWRGEHQSTVLWSSVQDAAAVHGHDGSTRFVWLDSLR